MGGVIVGWLECATLEEMCKMSSMRDGVERKTRRSKRGGINSDKKTRNRR